MMEFCGLPVDVLLLICRYLKKEELLSLAQCCRLTRDVAKEGWRELLLLAQKLMKLNNVPMSVEAVSRWAADLEECAERGHVKAKFAFGGVLRNPRAGVGFDRLRASRYITDAAAAGYMPAVYTCQWFGLGSYAKDPLAAALAVRPFEHSNDYALVRMAGQSYLTSNNIPDADNVRAMRCFERAANEGNDRLAITVCALLKLQNNAGPGLTQDLPQAVQYLQRGFALGDLNCIQALGVCYLEGIGVSEDMSRGLELIREAAAWGQDQANIRLAHYYAYGAPPLIEVNLELAVRHIEIALQTYEGPQRREQMLRAALQEWRAKLAAQESSPSGGGGGTRARSLSVQSV